MKLTSFKILTTALILTISLAANAQFFTIPDANFRNYLLAQHPSVLNGSQQLILANAKVYSSPISCINMGIADLSGIEYFYNITMINCSGNPITSLPSLDSLTLLQHFWAIGCQLTQIPPINHLIFLETLDLKSNQLTSLPALSGLVSLKYFDCSGSQLTSIPDLTGLSSLEALYCYNNQLASLPSLSTLVSLETLDCPSNLLTSLPSLSNNTALVNLRCANNKLTALPDLSFNTSLENIDVSNNKLTAIPNLSGYTALTSVKVQRNQLSFAQLLPQIAHPSFSSVFQFSPQDTLLNYPLVVLSRDTIGVLRAGVDAGISTNQYQWYKYATSLSTTTESLLLNAPSLSDTGLYWCKIQNTNPALSSLTLVVKSARVQIGTCLSASSFSYNIIANTCMKGATISFDEVSISSVFKPFTYYLTSAINTPDSYRYETPNFDMVNPGKYDLRIVDINNCELTLKQYINVPIPSDCDNIITPNGDGIDDVFFIDKTGGAKIFTKAGVLIKEIPLPGQWDATDKTGKIVDMGYYIVLVNNKDKMGVIVLE